jgi:hypothetical protein
MYEMQLKPFYTTRYVYSFPQSSAKRKHLRFAHFFAVAFAFNLNVVRRLSNTTSGSIHFFKMAAVLSNAACVLLFGTCIRQSSTADSAKTAEALSSDLLLLRFSILAIQTLRRMSATVSFYTR